MGIVDVARFEMEWRMALGYEGWERDAADLGGSGELEELARALGCEICSDGGTTLLRAQWGLEAVEANDSRLLEAMGDDEEVDAFCRRCALDRAYLDLKERGCGLGELPEWAWNVLVDDVYRARALDDLGNVLVAAEAPYYAERLFYVYRDIEAHVSGLGRSPWFDADFAYWYQV